VSVWSEALEVVTEVPPNAGTPLADQTGEELDPGSVYVRSNFPVPRIDPDSWVLRFELDDVVELGLDDLQAYPEVSVSMALECAGNGRTLMQPVPGGTPWTLGGASATSFQGAALSAVLADRAIPRDSVELVFSGADRGRVPHDGDVAYEFSLGVRDAIHGDALLAWGMGGQPLSEVHGAPVRLVVPGQYAMKSVKWLTGIRATREAFRGHFVRKYRYYSDEHEPEAAPVGPIRVRSLIAAPGDGDRVPAPSLRVAGTAWSDGSPIVSVDVSVDDGRSWLPADLSRIRGAYAPTPWVAELPVEPGPAVIVARATDDAGRTQPLTSRWNGNGYANNVVHRVRVDVVTSAP
jgi:sulfane dehydrogenase subunit SoxC